MDNINREQMEMARNAESIEEVISLAKEQGYDISESEAGKIYEYLHRHGELSEEELNSVSGGGCNDGGSTPKFSVGQTVYIVLSSYARKSHVTWVSSTKKKYGVIFKDETWAYNIIVDESPYLGKVKTDVPEYDLSKDPQINPPPFE